MSYTICPTVAPKPYTVMKKDNCYWRYVLSKYKQHIDKPRQTGLDGIGR